MKDETREPQYQRCLDLRDREGFARFGLMSNQVWHDDPKRLVFLLSRYKFVAKMFSGMQNVLEVGCADVFGARVVLQEVRHITAVDFDPVFIADALSHTDEHWQIECRVHDMLQGPIDGKFDGAFSLDVLEHIPQEEEDRFIRNVVDSLDDYGVLIMGTPSLQSQTYASALSREGHINCKNAKELKELMSCFFHNVFIFSMNDEVVHTGFYPMAHYLIALGCNKKQRSSTRPCTTMDSHSIF